MTSTLLIYDIPDDRLRSKVADACLDYGLDRIQYSAFLGDLTHNRQEEILQRVRRIIGKKPARVQFIPVCEKDPWSLRPWATKNVVSKMAVTGGLPGV